MALILAIEPDQRQAAQLADLIRHRLKAELVHAETTEGALVELAQIGDRVPDLILVPSLLSPQEDAALAGALRVIATAANVQMLTIPLLADPEQPPQHRGVFARWRPRKSSHTPGACDPAVFAEQIAAYLAEAAASRADHEDDEPAEMPEDAMVAEPASAPDVVPEVVRSSYLLETPVLDAVEIRTAEATVAVEAAEQPLVLAVIADPLPADLEPAPHAVEDGVLRADIDLAELEAGGRFPDVEDLGPSDREPAPAEHEVIQAAPEALIVDLTTLEGISLFAPLEADMTPAVGDVPVLAAPQPAIEAEPAIEVQIASGDEPGIAYEVLTGIDPVIEIEPVIDVEIAAVAAAAVDDEVTESQAVDVMAADITPLPPAEEETVDLLIAPLLREIEAARAPVLDVVETRVAAVPTPERNLELTRVEHESREGDRLSAISAQPLLAECGTPNAESHPGFNATPVNSGFTPEPIPAPAPEPVAEPSAEPVYVTASEPSPEEVAVSASEPQPEEKSVVASEPEPDPMFFAEDEASAPVAAMAAPPVIENPSSDEAHAAERPAWVELIESLRKDIERLRADRAAANSPTSVVAQPRPPRRREPKQAARPAANASRVALSRPRRKVVRPIQDQWGLFDPEQCGFGALLAKLDQLSAREDAAAYFESRG